MKILFCTQLSSLHAARWINQFIDTDWEIHVAENLVPGWGICPEFARGTFHLPKLLPSTTLRQTVCTFRGNRQYALRQRMNFPMPVAWLQEQHERYLANWIESEKPDVIHLLGLGVNWLNQGLPLLRIKQRLGGLPCPWILSSWGTDLDYFGRDPANQTGVKEVLRNVDVFVSECERDFRLAKEFEFKGKFGGFFPAFGGTDLGVVNQHRLSGKSSDRKLILLKGRDHANGGDPVGRAMTIMKSLEICAEDVKRAGCRVVILQSDATLTAEAHVLRATRGLDVEICPRLSYDGLMRLMGAARAVMAMTVNDGLPSILVEAMAFGALPVHSDLEPIREWITDGKNGLLVEAEDVDTTVRAIRRIVADDNFVDQAAEINAKLVATKLEYQAVRQRAIEMYERVTGGR